MAQKIKLKPCPFCGKSGTAVLSDACSDEQCGNFEDEVCPNYDPIGVRVDCEGLCPIHYVVCDVRKGGCGASTGWHETTEEAVKAWNTRYSENVVKIETPTLDAEKVMKAAIDRMEKEGLRIVKSDGSEVM